MIILAQQELVFQGPHDPAYFDETSMLIWWVISILVLITLVLAIRLIKRRKKNEDAIAIPNKSRDLHTWDNLISYWLDASNKNPYPLDLMICLLKQASYIITHQQPQQTQLEAWLNLTPQELAQRLTQLLNQQPHLQSIIDIKEYLQKLNYLEHLRFNPQLANVPQEQLLQSTISECSHLLTQVTINQAPSQEDHTN